MKSNKIMSLTCLFSGIFFMLSTGCAGTSYDAPEESQKIDHKEWTAMLQKHVDDKGDVDYEGFIEDSAELNTYLEKLSANPPAKNAKDNYSMAYWINAYNAFTVKLIVDNYPVESIRDLHPTLKIPGVNTVWHKEFFQIGGQDMSLDHIEHKILREEYEEPRIHFAINCASESCPPLRREAYTADKLESQLKEQAKTFINNDKYNKITSKSVQLSRIFDWFQGDFTKKGSLTAFLNKYSDVTIHSSAEVSYLDYDWALNKQ